MFKVETLTSSVLLYFPRLIVFMFSLLDSHICARIISNKLLRIEYVDQKRILLLYHSFWCTFLFYTRTYSNTFETFFINFLLLLCLKLREKGNIYYAGALGIIFGIGCFIRVTFPLFSFIPLFYTLYSLIIEARLKSFNKENYFKMVQLNPAIKYLTSFVVSAIVTIIFIVCYDSLYVKSRLDAKTLNWQIAPTNNFLYNADPKNLVKHGINPRWLHILINMPLLFSPLWLKAFLQPWKIGGGSYRLAFFQILFPLLILSLIPHQEPRFLLPLALPVAIILSRFTYWYDVVHLTSQIILLAFYCFYHQVAAITLILDLEGLINKNLQVNTSVCVFTHDTYIIPRYLLKLDQSVNLIFIDLEILNVNKICAEVTEYFTTDVCDNSYLISQTQIIEELVSCLGSTVRKLFTVQNSFSGESFGFFDYSLSEILR